LDVNDLLLNAAGIRRQSLVFNAWTAERPPSDP